MSSVVLDASAVLALLNAEPGCEQVEAALPGASISAVNLAEVVGKLADKGMPGKAARDAVLGLGLDVRPFDVEDAFDVAALRAGTRDAGLSLGDRACLALGARLARPIVTADREWKKLKLDVRVQVVR